MKIKVKHNVLFCSMQRWTIKRFLCSFSRLMDNEIMESIRAHFYNIFGLCSIFKAVDRNIYAKMTYLPSSRV